MLLVTEVLQLMAADVPPAPRGSAPDRPVTLDNFASLFADYNFLSPVLNSVQSSLGSAVLSLIIGAPAAYALSRARVRSAGIVGGWLLFARALPAIGLSVPAYAIFSQLHITDTIVALLLVYLPYNVALATILQDHTQTITAIESGD